MQTNSSFMRAAISSLSKDSRSITWHQWQAEYPMLISSSLFSRLRLVQGLVAPGIPVHGVVGVLEQVGAGLVDQAVGMCMWG